MNNENLKDSSRAMSKSTTIIVASVIIAGAIVIGSAILSGEKGGVISTTKNSDLKAQVGTITKKEIGIDETFLEKCLSESQKYQDLVNEDFFSGKVAGAKGTPYNIILLKDGTTIVIPGALPFEDEISPEGEIVMIGMKSRISAILSSQSKDLSSIAEDINLSPITKDDHLMGSENSEIIIVEYSDIDCPFCKRFHPTMEKIVKEFSGQVAWVYRHFPIDELHPEARKKAEISECIADLKGEEAFWKYLESVIY